MSLSEQHTDNSATDSSAADNRATGNQAKSIFLAALEIQGDAERRALLDERCGDDQALRREVARLLAHESDVGSFLESPPPGVDSSADATADYSAAPVLGSQIGPYKLLQQLGEGGMGIVYLAERQHPVKLRVALKLIKHGMDSRRFVARFEAERQALAMMDHPNIARVLDAGCTDSGRPYFVMELVKGVPISEFCDENRLTTRQRLELFVQVCQAVQHAHQKGIIHRDLKPSNVLVAMYDDKPVPKVIDFGVAKATNQQLTEKTLFTEIGSILGTWEYMSPEQAVLNQLDVDTRTDVYSLGVLLYELLTGETPLDRQRLREAQIMETLRMIREDEPPKPSTRLSSQGERATATAAYRRSKPDSLASEVRGDLDWIVMKALAKERARRYDSASRLAEDVQRHLNNELVEARPPSVWYQARKFYQRNRGLATGVAATLLALALGFGATTWGWAVVSSKKNELLAQQVELKGLSDALAQRNADLGKVVNDYRQETFERGLLAAMFGDEETVDEIVAKKDVLTKQQTDILIGLLSVYKGDSSDAVSKLERAAKEPEASLCTLALLAKAQLDSGQVDAFRRTRARVLTSTPWTNADFIALGNLQTYYDAKSAKVTLDDVVARTHSPLAMGIRAELLWQTALGHWDLEMSDQATRDIKAAVRIQPNLPYLHVVHAYSLMAQMFIEERLGNQLARDQYRQQVADAIKPLEKLNGYSLGRHTIATYHDNLGNPGEAHRHWEVRSGNWMQLYFAASLFRCGLVERAMTVLERAGDDELTRGIRAQATAFLARLEGKRPGHPSFEADLAGKGGVEYVEQEFLVLPESIMLLAGEKQWAIGSCKSRGDNKEYRNQWEEEMLELVLQHRDWDEYCESNENSGYHKATAMQLRGFVCFADRERWRDAVRFFERSVEEAPFAVEACWSLAFAKQLQAHLARIEDVGERD